jgi:hypothetical protein
MISGPDWIREAGIAASKEEEWPQKSTECTKGKQGTTAVDF